jgi:hypothetical protein
VLAALAALLTAGGVWGADAPSVYPKHPRLLFRADEVAQIRERCRRPLFAPLYAAMKTWADERIAAADGKGDMVTFGFLYQMEGDPAYAEEAKRRLLASPGMETAFLTPTFSMKYTYDLIYAALSPQEQPELARKILAMHMSNRYKNPVMGLHQICNEGSSTLAVWGDPGVDMEVLRARHKRERAALHANLIPRGNVIADRWGGWHRSFECECWTKYVARFAELWLNATGENVFDNPIIRSHGAWYLYHTLPGFREARQFRLVPDGYTQFGQGLRVNDRGSTLILGKRLNEGLSMWWWQQPLTRSHLWGFGAYQTFFRTLSLEGLRKRDQDKIASVGTLWRLILYFDPTVEPLHPNSFPEDAYHRGMGLVSTRSGWDDQAAFAFFHCGRMANGKPDDLDNNNFLIYRNGFLATDGWPPGKTAHYGREWDNYRRRTIAHNLITVFDPDEPLTNFWSQYCDVGGEAGTAGKALSNDGGQLGQNVLELDPALHPWKEEHHVNIYKPVGEITAFRTTPDYCYILGDASKSYSPHKLSAFTREFVFLKPDIFVVFDRVVTTRSEYQKTWHIHPMQQPAVAGNTFRWQAYRPPTNLRNRQPGPLGWLIGTTLLPAESRTTVIGGKGKECWVDGTNYHTVRGKEVSRGHHTESDKADWRHSWRLDVQPAQPATEDLFLHVLQTFPDTPVAEATVALIREEGRVGASVTMGERRWQVTFARDGSGGGGVQLVADGAVSVDDVLPVEIEDTYKAWQHSPRYARWTTDPRYRIVVPAGDRRGAPAPQ